MAILSIQSRVSYGYVGNSIAVPAIQAAGLEAWPLDTVAFSNHPGHGRFRGGLRPAGELKEQLEGIAELGVLKDLSAILSGYLGLPESAEVVADALQRARSGIPDLPYILDPVIGDHGRSFVRDGVAEAIRERLLPQADYLTPNIYELGILAGKEVAPTLAEIVRAARGLMQNSRLKAVAVTGIERGERIGNLLVLPQRALIAEAPRHERNFNGTGDLFAALLTAWLVRAGGIEAAFARACGGLELATAVTVKQGRKELALPHILRGLRSLRPAPLRKAD